MKTYTAIDNIMWYQQAIWAVAKMLKYSGRHLDETELRGVADAILDQCSKIESRSFDLKYDEEDSESEHAIKIRTVKAILDHLENGGERSERGKLVNSVSQFIYSDQLDRAIIELEVSKGRL